MEEGKDLQAHANNLVYDIRKRTLVLTGDAYIEHLGNTFEGAKVEYSLDSKRVDASSEGDKRVRLVIPAENQTPEQAPPADDNENGEAPEEPSPEAEPNTQ
jgi:lipopolysaccharide export system protein LptA